MRIPLQEAVEVRHPVGDDRPLPGGYVASRQPDTGIPSGSDVRFVFDGRPNTGYVKATTRLVVALTFTRRRLVA